MKLSVCIDAVLAKFDITEALDIVSKCGIPAFEFWRWWDKDLEWLKANKEKFQNIGGFMAQNPLK